MNNLTVNARLGHGNQILRLFAKRNLIDDGVPVPPARKDSTDDTSPFFDIFGLPVLITWPQRSLGRPLLSGNGGAQKLTIPLPTLAGTSGPYKGVVPISLLSASSPAVPQPTLTDSNGGYKPIIPLPMLSQ